MKFSRLFRLGKQGYNAYRGYKGQGRGRYSSKRYGGRRSGGTLERLIRRLLR